MQSYKSNPTKQFYCFDQASSPPSPPRRHPLQDRVPATGASTLKDALNLCLTRQGLGATAFSAQGVGTSRTLTPSGGVMPRAARGHRHENKKRLWMTTSGFFLRKTTSNTFWLCSYTMKSFHPNALGLFKTHFDLLCVICHSRAFNLLKYQLVINSADGCGSTWSTWLFKSRTVRVARAWEAEHLTETHRSLFAFACRDTGNDREGEKQAKGVRGRRSERCGVLTYGRAEREQERQRWH